MGIYIYQGNERKQTKVYPEMYNTNGFFPTEDEFIKGKSNNDTGKLIEKDELKKMDEKLKEYFKKRYKISDELSEFYTYKNVYKLKIIK